MSTVRNVNCIDGHFKPSLPIYADQPREQSDLNIAYNLSNHMFRDDFVKQQPLGFD